MTDSKIPDAVTLERASRYLGLSLRQIRRLIQRHELVAYRYSRHATRVDVQSLKTFREKARSGR